MENARALTAAGLRVAEGTKLLLDAPDADGEWNLWFTDIGFKEAQAFIRMCRGETNCPEVPGSPYATAGPSSPG